MSLIEKIYNTILIDKEIYENRYWDMKLENNKIHIIPLISYSKTVFMGELFHKDNINSYFLKLDKKFPVNIYIHNYQNSQTGILNKFYIIEIENIRHRKMKIDFLLN